MSKYIERLLQLPNRSFFLLGPRGTGKTTWVRHELPRAHRFDLLDEALYQSLLADVSRFSAELRTLRPGSWVFVDEVQRLPRLLNEVHRAIEDRSLKFVLTGSSARKLKQTGVNLLAGRALFKQMYPFLPSELGSRFSLENALKWGSIPLIWNATEKTETLRAYVQLYLKEEIRAEALVRNLPGFARFLPVAALFHGQTLNLAAAARDAEISRTTLSGYIEILEDTLLVFRVPAFEGKLRVRERKHPKLYWLDPGLVRAVRNQLGEVHAEERGALFEGWIAAVLRAYSDYQRLFEKCWYWSPGSSYDTEVDFLLQTPEGFVAIEAKSGKTLHGNLFRGLKAITGLQKLQRRILIYTGGRKMAIEKGIEVWPVEHFLEVLDRGKLW